MKTKLLTTMMALLLSASAWAQTTLVTMTTIAPEVNIYVEYTGSGEIQDANGKPLTSEYITLLTPDDDGIVTLKAVGDVTLTYLDCYDNQLTGLDVSSCTELMTLDCSSNKLTGLDVSACTALGILMCHINKLTNLNVSGCTELVELTCSTNQLKSLDVSGCTALGMLDCSANQLTTLDITGRTGLTFLHASGQRIIAPSETNPIRYINASGVEVPITISGTEYAFGDPLPDDINFFTTTALVNGDPFGGRIIIATAYLPVTLVTMTTTAPTVGVYIKYTGDGEIEDADGNPLTNNNFTTLTPDDDGIVTLKAVGDVTLTYLYCPDNELTGLDVSACTALTYLYCDNNQLTTLDVSTNTALTYLACPRNQLTGLDVSGFTALERLFLEENRLTSLDVSGCTTLEHLSLEENRLTSLDVSDCSALTTLYCGNNQLTNLDVSGCTELATLNCYGNKLTGLDVSGCTALEYLYCQENKLTTLNITGCEALGYISASGQRIIAPSSANLIRYTPVSGTEEPITINGTPCPFGDPLPADFNTFTTTAPCDGDPFGGRIIIAAAYLPVTIVTMTTNAPTVGVYIEYSGAGEIEDADGNPLTNYGYATLTPDDDGNIELKAVGEVMLTYLDCTDNELTDLNVSGCTALTDLSCGGNELTGLDVSSCTALTWLHCTDNSLTTLDVSGCTALAWLNCSNNQLTGLDVSGCTELTTLYCYNNQLTTLNVAGFTALEYLECADNHLSTLDVSGCTALTSLYSQYNHLTTLNITECTALEDFIADNQTITATGSANPISYINADGDPESIMINGSPYPFGATLPTGDTWSFYTTATVGIPFSGTITVPAAPESNDATLATLTVSAGTLSPAFDAGTTSYTVSVANSVSEITIGATAAHAAATIAAGATGAKNLNVGDNPFDIVVTAEDGTPKTYTIIVTRAAVPVPSSDATLATLTVSAGTLSPAFDAGTTSYTVNVGNNVSEITIGATANHAAATIAGTGSKSLSVGDNPFDIVVTAEDGTPKTYTIIVTRAAAPVLSNDATLASLIVSNGILSPCFDANTTNYTAFVSNRIGQTMIYALANHGEANVTGAGPKALNIGDNPFDIVVTAEDGTKKTYTVNIIRAASLSSDATLATLTVSEGTLSPAFDAGTTSYSVSVINSVSEITITAAATDGYADVAGAGTYALAVGSNPFDIVVTAEDGTTTKTYTVAVTRAAAPALSNDATLASLTVSAGTLSPAFDAGTTSYTVGVANAVEAITFTAAASDGKAGVAGAGTHALAVGENRFDIVVTAEDGTTKTYTVTVARETLTGVEEVNVADVKIYQSNGILYIESSEYIKDVRLHNAAGVLVFRKINVGNSISVPTLSKGVYILTVVTTNGETVRKIKN